MFWEIVKTALLSLLVIYLSHQIYLSFFRKTRAIPSSLLPDSDNKMDKSHDIKPTGNDNISSSEQNKDNMEKESDNDMKSELMDFLNNSGNETNINESSLGVTNLADLPNDEK